MEAGLASPAEEHPGSPRLVPHRTPTRRPWQPRPRPRPSRCVWRSTSQVSPCTCSAAQLRAQFSFLFNPQINMCSYIFNREAVFIRVGISFTSFSPLLRRHSKLTCNTSRLMRERPGARTGPGTPAVSEPLRVPASPSAWALPSSCLPTSSPLGQTCSPPPTLNTCWKSLPRGAPWGPFRSALHPRPAKSQENKGQQPGRGQRGRSPSDLPSRIIDFSFQLRMTAEQNKLSPFRSVITVTLSPSCHLLPHQNRHLAKLEGRRGHGDL